MHMEAKENQEPLYFPTTSQPQEARFQHTQWLLWKINIIKN